MEETDNGSRNTLSVKENTNQGIEEVVAKETNLETRAKERRITRRHAYKMMMRKQGKVVELRIAHKSWEE